MAITAVTIFDEARFLLNDVAATKYTNAVLVPALKKAYRSYQHKMSRAGLDVVEEVSTAITVTAGTKALGDGSGLPIDFIFPLDVKERAPGASDKDWVALTYVNWDVTVEAPQSTLGVWSWREEEIKFRGSTANREVLLHYVKTLAAIQDQTSPIQMVSAEGFLAAKTAAIAALVIGENETRATALNGNAQEEWQDFFAARINRKHSRPVRRRVNRFRQ